MFVVYFGLQCGNKQLFFLRQRKLEEKETADFSDRVMERVRQSSDAPSAPIGLLLEREGGGKERRGALGLRG